LQCAALQAQDAARFTREESAMLRSITLLLALSALAMPSAAHHSFTLNFDMTRVIELRGTVVEFKLRSPHSSMVIEGREYTDGNPVGMVERWEVESFANGGMRAMGIQPDTFKPGDTITLIANPNREAGFRFVNSASFITPQRSYSRADMQQPERVREDAVTQSTGIERLSGRWQSPGAFGSSSPLPLTARGRQAQADFDPRRSPANTCEPMNFPDIFLSPYPAELRLEDEALVVFNAPWEVERRIPLDDKPARPRIDGLFGVVRGRIDGDSIVLESGGFIPSGWGLGSATQQLGGGADIPSSVQKRLVERFSVSTDGLTLVYEYTLSDPVFLTAPYSGRLELFRIDASQPIDEYDCDLESSSMFSRTSED
jgi:hypothetical protein